MAITTLAQMLAAPTQHMVYQKTAGRVVSAGQIYGFLDLAGDPPAGTLAGTSTTAGVVPTSATAGFPAITPFVSGATGYITDIDLGLGVTSSVAQGRVTLYDLLFKAGAYAFNAATTLSAQPSYSSRVPGGTDYSGLEIWVESVTAFTGNLSLAVTYTNESGATGRTTGTITSVSGGVGRLVQLPLQSGDSGVQKIESVTATVATAGTFNVLVMRRLFQGRIGINGTSQLYELLKVARPQIYADSALYVTLFSEVSNSSGWPYLAIDIANG